MQVQYCTYTPYVHIHMSHRTTSSTPLRMPTADGSPHGYLGCLSCGAWLLRPNGASFSPTPFRPWPLWRLPPRKRSRTAGQPPPRDGSIFYDGVRRDGIAQWTLPTARSWGEHESLHTFLMRPLPPLGSRLCTGGSAPNRLYRHGQRTLHAETPVQNPVAAQTWRSRTTHRPSAMLPNAILA